MRQRTRVTIGLAIGALTTALVAPAATAAGRVDVIVVYADGVADSRATTEAVARQHGAQPRWVYEHAIEGFAGNVPEGRLNGLRNDPRVDHVTLDQPVTATVQDLPTGVQRISADENSVVDVDGADDVRVDVDVAVIDTGIDLDHPDLVVAGGAVDCLGHSGGPPSRRTYACVEGGDDDNGHGTHVAGTIGALDDDEGVVGVAPGARVHAVKVLDHRGSGSWASVIAGIDWVTSHASTIEVANLSLGGGESADVDSALTAAADAGVALALAAGNNGVDVDGYGPAGHPRALTVSALADYDGEPDGRGAPTCGNHGADDHFANWSNFGEHAEDDVDVIAPGACILSTSPGGGQAIMSGTSMAAPHVAGALALLASGSGAPANFTDVEEIYASLLVAADGPWTSGTDPDRSTDPLLDVGDETVFAPSTVDGLDSDGGSGGDDTSTNEAPSASFTYDCTGLQCTFDASGSSDSDGAVSSYAWTFGDGGTATGTTASHTYGTGGDYPVTLTVMDDDGAEDAEVQTVTASSTGDSAFTLSVTPYKVKGVRQADLSWTGSGSASVEIHRDGRWVVTTDDDGQYTDDIGQKGGGVSHRYVVCEAGTDTCSNEATATF